MSEKLTERDVVKLLREKAQRYLDSPGVTSVGVGYRVDGEKETDELCIQFTVERKFALERLEAEGLRQLPESIEDDNGNQVRVQVFERKFKPDVVIVQPRSGSRGYRRKRQDTLRPGISIAHEDATAGTLGAIVYDRRTGRPHMLSNWHVLQGHAGRIGDRVLQPGPYDGGTPADSVAGRLTRGHLGLAGDCAVASIEDRGFDATIVDLNIVPSPTVGRVELKDRGVVKSGRTTGVTRGIVKRVGLVVSIDYPGSTGKKAIGGFEIVPDPDYPIADGEVSSSGDSGSLWMIAEGEHEGTPVGLHFAGETDPAPGKEHAIACNIHSVLDKLDVSFDPGVRRASASARLRQVLDRTENMPAAQAEEDDDEPELTAEDINEMQQRLRSDSKETLAYFRAAIEESVTEEQIDDVLEDLRAALENPEALQRAMSAAESLESSAKLPSDFTFPGMDPSRYPIRPGLRKFEPFRDIRGWFCYLAYFLKECDKVQLPIHTKTNPFCYKLEEPSQDSLLEIALFSDWGTGEYQSNYISKQIEDRVFPVGIHLGDVYYGGSEKEFRQHVREPLAAAESRTKLFFLNANHEMMSGGKGYFKHIQGLRKRNPGHQVQQGSYFALESEKFQIVGIDTAYYKNGRFPDDTHREWLENRLREGKKTNRFNILLSANQPYEYGKKGFTKLFEKDLRCFAEQGLIDLWFWGNNHYCALFDKGERTPFIGSCIGHGGFPYRRKKYGKHEPAPLKFLETGPRFPAWTELRQGRGNNGFCILKLTAAGGIVLEYIDWMRRPRATAKLEGKAGRLEIV